MKKGFTLTETLIVLVVIGILAAILLPVARNIVPDRNLTKFKKAHNTLGAAIRELVQSEEYYLNGDLGTRVNGEKIDGNHSGDITYFCETMADVLNLKTKNCSQLDEDFEISFWQINTTKYIDLSCRKTKVDFELITSDNIYFYQTAPKITFGIRWADASPSLKADCQDPAFYQAYKPNCDYTPLFAAKSSAVTDDNDFGGVYKVLCIDIDGRPSNATEDDCVNECPFGYGIRADGKILTGARAQEWLEKE